MGQHEDIDHTGLVGTGIPPTLFDAKGDLIVASAADTAARLAAAANGASLVTASAESTGLKWRLNKYGATVPPAVTDDSGDGYEVGSEWIDETGDMAYKCVDASVGAAVWIPFDSASGDSWEGAWSAGSYTTGQIVEHNDVIYQANTTTSAEPPDADWDVLYTAPVGGGGSGYIAAITAETGITAYWPLNEEGTTYADAIGSADMTALATTPGFCATLTKDAAGGSLHIPSATFRIGRAALTWGASYTIEGWVIPGTDFVFGQWNSAGSMILKSGAQVYAYAGGGSINFTPSAAELAGRHHVALTHDGTNLRLYWDGVLKAGPTALAIPGTNVGGSWRVGSYSDTTTVGSAIYSDIAFYSGRVLTAGELLAHYNLGA